VNGIDGRPALTIPRNGCVDGFVATCASMTNRPLRGHGSTALLVCVLAACSGAEGAPSSGSGVTVTVAPPSVRVAPGGTQGFQAVVTGAAVSSVQWSVEGGDVHGTITSAGLYAAPAASGAYRVIATSVADPAQSGSATVTVTSATQVAAPTFSPGTGSTVASGSPVTLNVATAGATICYTTNGVDPAASTPGTCSSGSTTYVAPIVVTANVTIRALATLANATSSAVVAATYAIAAAGSGTVQGYGFGALTSGSTLKWPWAYGDAMGFQDGGGNREVLVFGWNGTRVAAVKSGDAGASWTAVNPSVSLGEPTSTGVNAWGPKSVVQTSDGKVHVLSVSAAGTWHYSRVTLVRTAGSVTGYTLDVGPVALTTPSPPFEFRGHLLPVRDAAGNERIAFVYHDSTGGLNARSRVQVTTPAAGTAPTSASHFQTIAGTAISGTNDVVYSAAISGMDTTQNWGSHCYTSLPAQDGATRDLYVFLGGVNTGDNPSMSPIKAVRLAASGTTWTVDTSIPAFGTSGTTAPLALCAARGTATGVWVAYNDVASGITIDKLSGAGIRTPNIVPRPGTPSDAFAMCAMGVASDESQVFMGWLIGSSRVSAVYTRGAWKKLSPTGTVGDWGTAGTAGWDTGLTWAGVSGTDGALSAATISSPR
jgi:hypothetical protein